MDYLYLDGQTSARDREAHVHVFQSGTVPFFLISLKAGGFGLNLTAATNVIHLDPWWNPATEDQASDRAHRIGQERPVTIYRMVALGTIEEKMLGLHVHKRELADTILDGSDRAGTVPISELIALIAAQPRIDDSLDA
jgi:SNF2 family DNA or RNA helicase